MDGSLAAAKAIAASTTADKQKNNPETVVITATATTVATVAEAIATSATADEQKNNPETTVISETTSTSAVTASATTSVNIIVTSATTVR